MFGGGVIISTAIVSRFMLNRLILRHHALGCIFCFIGFLAVGLAAMFFGGSSASSEYTPEQTAIGIGLVLVTQVIRAV